MQRMKNPTQIQGGDGASSPRRSVSRSPGSPNAVHVPWRRKKNPKERKNARIFGRRKEGDLAETNVVVGEEQLQQQKQWFQVAGFFVIPLGESGVVGW